MRQVAQVLSSSARQGLEAGQELSGQAQAVSRIVSNLEELVGRAG
jgi:hypothetical protein